MTESFKNTMAVILFCLMVFGIVGRVMQFGTVNDGPSFQHVDSTPATDRAWAAEQLNNLSRYRGDGTIFSAAGNQNEDLLIFGAPYCDKDMSMLPPQWQDILRNAKFSTIDCHEGVAHDQDTATAERQRLPAPGVGAGDSGHRGEQGYLGAPRGCRLPM